MGNHKAHKGNWRPLKKVTMLNILNRAVQRKLFAEADPTFLLSFLNEGFFQGTEKVTAILQTDDLAESLLHCQSCFQDTMAYKVKTSENRVVIVQIDIIRVHPGKDTSFIKLREEYFNLFLKMKASYAYRLPLRYIGLFTFDIEALDKQYHFKQSANNYPIHFHFINLATWAVPQKETWTIFEQWMCLLTQSHSLASTPTAIKHPTLLEVVQLLDAANWTAADKQYYDNYENQWEERINRVLALYRELKSPLLKAYLEQPATKVQLSIRTLFNQLIPQKLSIKMASFEEKALKKTAFTVFRSWIKQTNQQYPEMTIVIKDERPIIADFSSSLSRALKSLLQSDKYYTHFKTGWDIGYVLGYLQGSLSVHWHHEYVIKQTNPFKILTALQVFRDYLKFNDTLKIQLKDLYETFLTDNANLQGLDTTIQATDFVHSGKVIEGNEIGKEDTMLIVLENMVNTQVHKTLNNDQFKAIDFEIADTVPEAIIQSLIEENRLRV